MSVKSKNINHRMQNAKIKFQQRYNNVLNWEALIDVSKIMVKIKKKTARENISIMIKRRQGFVCLHVQDIVFIKYWA